MASQSTFTQICSHTWLQLGFVLARPCVRKSIVTDLPPPRIKVHAAELKGHTEGHLLFCRILLELGNWEIMDLGSKQRVRQGWQ